jgi:hypothetical protein
MFKKIFELIIIAFGIVLFLLLAFIGYKNIVFNLSDFKQYENVVTFKGEMYTKRFYLNLMGSDKTFTLHRISKDYNDLLQEIEIGDTVRIYFQENEKANQFIEIIQLEKNETTVISKKENSFKYSIIFIISISAALIMLYLGYLRLKNKEFENPIPPFI